MIRPGHKPKSLINHVHGFSYLIERGVVCGAGAWAKGDIEGSPAMDEAYEMGLRA